MRPLKLGWMILLAAMSLPSWGQAASDWDGLVEIKPKHLDAVSLRPGTDFSSYTKLMLDPVEVAFAKDWARDYNRNAATLSQRLTDADLARLAAAARENFTEVFAEACRNAGLEIVTAPGPDVLRVRAGILDLAVAAPDIASSNRSRTFTMEAGRATLFLEARDSVTGALLGRALDRRATRNTGRVQVSNSVTNLADFRVLFRQWADISIKGFRELRESAPVEGGPKPASN
jgi:hypothetical protein